MVRCKKDAGTGYFTGIWLRATMNFSKCNNQNKEACTITTEPQKGELHYTNKTEEEAGIEFSGERFATIKCGTEMFELKGNLIGSIKNGSKGMTVTFATNAGKQALNETWESNPPKGGPFNPYYYLEAYPGLTEEEEATVVSTETFNAKHIGVYLEK